MMRRTTQGLGDFFMDDLWRYEAAWAVPTPAVQAQLMDVIQHTSRATQLHHKPYSLVSYAWGQRWMQAHGYRPTVLRIGALTRLGGRMGAANIAFDDHPTDQRFSDQIATVTVDSVFDWMTRAGLTTQAVWYKHDHSTP